MKKVYTRIGKDSDVYIYTVDDSGYYCMLGAKHKCDFLNDASSGHLQSFLFNKKVKVPQEFLDHLASDAWFNRLLKQQTQRWK